MSEPEAAKKRLPIANGAAPSGGAAPKRRLPVLQADEVVEGDEDRPPWHWSVIGTIAIFLVWLPLAAGASAFVSAFVANAGDSRDRLARGMPAMVVLNALA